MCFCEQEHGGNAEKDQVHFVSLLFFILLQLFTVLGSDAFISLQDENQNTPTSPSKRESVRYFFFLQILLLCCTFKANINFFYRQRSRRTPKQRIVASTAKKVKSAEVKLLYEKSFGKSLLNLFLLVSVFPLFFWIPCRQSTRPNGSVFMASRETFSYSQLVTQFSCFISVSATFDCSICHSLTLWK